MGEVPAELAFRAAPSISESERVDPCLRQYDVFVETTTQMLATPKLNERLLLALEGIQNIFGHRQAAIAIINERDAELRVRAAVGFDGEATRIEMPIDSSAACVRVIHEAVPLWISMRRRRGIPNPVRQNAVAGGRACAATFWNLRNLSKTRT